MNLEKNPTKPDHKVSELLKISTETEINWPAPLKLPELENLHYIGAEEHSNLLSELKSIQNIQWDKIQFELTKNPKNFEKVLAGLIQGKDLNPRHIREDDKEEYSGMTSDRSVNKEQFKKISSNLDDFKMKGGLPTLQRNNTSDRKPKGVRKLKGTFSSGVKTRQQVKKKNENKKEKGWFQAEDLKPNDPNEEAKSQIKSNESSEHYEELEREECMYLFFKFIAPKLPQFQMSTLPLTL